MDQVTISMIVAALTLCAGVFLAVRDWVNTQSVNIPPVMIILVSALTLLGHYGN